MEWLLHSGHTRSGAESTYSSASKQRAASACTSSRNHLIVTLASTT
jgi:hypothetical protein